MSAEPSPPVDDPQQRAYLRFLVAVGGLAVGIGALTLTSASVTRWWLFWPVLVLAFLIVLTIRSPRLVRFWDTWGEIVAVLVVATIVAATGGVGSAFHRLYILPLLTAAVLHGTRELVIAAAGVAIGLASPVLYDDPVQAYAATTFLDFGTWLLAAGVLHVLARRQRAEARRRQVVEDRFRVLADAAGDGIYRLRLWPDRQFEYVNRALEQLTGYSADEWYADPDLTLKRIHPDDLPRIVEGRSDPDRVYSEPVEVRWQRPDGTWVWHAVLGSALRDDGGRLVALQGVVRDVTGRKQAEESLRRQLEQEQAAADELRQVDELKTTFLRAVSHELRTPLTGILGFSALLRDRLGEFDPRQSVELLDRVIGNAERLEELLGDLLDVDRLSRGQGSLQVEPVDLARLVREAAAESAPGIDVTFDLQPAVVPADRVKVERIVTNLVSNAARHTPPGTPVWARTLVDEDGAALIIVEDAGAGVPDVLKEEIFEPFRQGDAAANSAAPGTGIGLTLVARFAELHGGRAWVEDRAGGGARFVVRIPDAHRPVSPA
ncbi:MAG: PAS domain-containing sensor histidine kinase [Nitriliruptorales bacterium]